MRSGGEMSTVLVGHFRGRMALVKLSRDIAIGFTFSLTPALSRWEREKTPSSSDRGAQVSVVSLRAIFTTMERSAMVSGTSPIMAMTLGHQQLNFFRPVSLCGTAAGESGSDI